MSGECDICGNYGHVEASCPHQVQHLLMSERRVVVLYCDSNRLYWSDSLNVWVVRGGSRQKKNAVLYEGSSFSDALDVLSTKLERKKYTKTSRDSFTVKV